MTVERLFRAQAQLAKQNKATTPVNNSQGICEDCDRPIQDDYEDHQCVNCGKSVCKYCSIKSIHRNDVVECLSCV
jgi:hypothetical protein